MFQRGSVYYVEDTTPGKQESLKTKERNKARRLYAVRNEAHVQSALNLHIARAYLSAVDPQMSARTRQKNHGGNGAHEKRRHALSLEQRDEG